MKPRQLPVELTTEDKVIFSGICYRGDFHEPEDHCALLAYQAADRRDASIMLYFGTLPGPPVRRLCQFFNDFPQHGYWP